MLLRVGLCFAMLLACALPARAGDTYAPTTLSAADIFDLNRHAIGSEAPGAYHIVSQRTSQKGDVWTYETYLGRTGYRTTVRQGAFAWSFGSYEARPWNQDVNGMISNEGGSFELNDPFTAAIGRSTDPNSGVKVLGLTTSSAPELVVEVTPGDGLTERRFYDATTHLLDRVEMIDYDGHKQAWIYGDYSSVFGKTLAHAVSYERDGVAVSQTKLLTYERITGKPPDLSVPESRRLFDPGSGDAAIPAIFSNDGVLVPVIIGNRTFNFLLDSGSSDMVIDPTIARDLGMESSGALPESLGGDYLTANTRAPMVTVGSLSAAGVAFSTAPLKANMPDESVAGLLGGDFIGSGALEVNFEKKTVTLHRDVPPNLAAQGWSALPIRNGDRVPMLKAAFSGKEGTFIVDTGAAYSTLYPHYFAQFGGRIDPSQRNQEELVMIGGRPFGITHLTMHSLVLGDWAFADVQVVVPSVFYAQERDYDGLIGREILSTFNLIFDYRNNRLWFKPIDFK